MPTLAFGFGGVEFGMGDRSVDGVSVLIGEKGGESGTGVGQNGGLDEAADAVVGGGIDRGPAWDRTDRSGNRR